MAANTQKTPLARTLNEFAQRKALGAMAQLGKSLPASVVSRTGGIVTVKFELTAIPYTLPNVTVPMIGSEYIRLPIQAGCLGWVIPADTYLGGMSGLGGGTAGLGTIANLSALVWSPIGNKNWADAIDDDALCLYGPDGVILYSVDKTVTVKFTKTEVSITPAMGIPIMLNGNVVVTGDLALTGNITAPGGGTYPHDLKTSGGLIAGFGTGDQVGLQTHTHKQTVDSHGDTEADVLAPTAGT